MKILKLKLGFFCVFFSHTHTHRPQIFPKNFVENDDASPKEDAQTLFVRVIFVWVDICLGIHLSTYTVVQLDICLGRGLLGSLSTLPRKLVLASLQDRTFLSFRSKMNRVLPSLVTWKKVKIIQHCWSVLLLKVHQKNRLV